MMSSPESDPIRSFVERVYNKLKVSTAGEPEDQLRNPFEQLFSDVSATLGHKPTIKGESLVASYGVRPDFAVTVDDLLCGYVELKAPGVGANPSRFHGRNKEQWDRLSNLPNVLLFDGEFCALYNYGNRIGNLVQLCSPFSSGSQPTVTPNAFYNLQSLISEFMKWEPVVPISAKHLAEVLAPICRLIRTEVNEVLERDISSLKSLMHDWRDLLFPILPPEQFSDAYSQTLVFALLLAKVNGGNVLDWNSASRVLERTYTLLSKAIVLLTDSQVRAELPTSLRVVQRTINAVKPSTFKERSGGADPWLYFYEDFLQVYDPALRQQYGAYYTPVEVVHAQIRLVDSILKERFHKQGLGLASDDVVVLDPGVGTGTYLLGILDQITDNTRSILGPGSITSRIKLKAESIHGFEIMVGPYSVAELRIAQAMANISKHAEEEVELATGKKNTKTDKKADPSFPATVYLTDTLSSPKHIPTAPPLFAEPIAREQKRALKVKNPETPVLVCIGNPPYEYNKPPNERQSGGWVRFGDEDDPTKAIFYDFVKPVKEAGYEIHLKHLYDASSYFWRWALWKVFEQSSTCHPGIVSFICPSRFLSSKAFVGMRKVIRELATDVYIINLGGDSRSARKSQNVFNIRTPVAIAIVVADDSKKGSVRVRYSSIPGSRSQKLSALDNITDISHLKWDDAPSGLLEPFVPIGSGEYYSWPTLQAIFPLQINGAQYKRIWPIAPLESTLQERWSALLRASDRKSLFSEKRDRKVDHTYRELLSDGHGKSIQSESKDGPFPGSVKYLYRPFDYQYAISDNRVGDFIRRCWKIHESGQLYLISSLTKPIGNGPAAIFTNVIPDMDSFCGRGAKDVIPLYRHGKPNISPGLLSYITEQVGLEIQEQDLFCYFAAVLSSPYFTDFFAAELSTTPMHVPLTLSKDLLCEGISLGKRIIACHVGAKELMSDGISGDAGYGSARCLAPISENPDKYPLLRDISYEEENNTLHIGDGVLYPVTREQWNYEVSGYRVLSGWLEYRVRDGVRKHSSDLDLIGPPVWPENYTMELLKLLWKLEAIVGFEVEQESFIEKVLQSDLLDSGDVPAAPAWMKTLKDHDSSKDQQPLL